MKKKSRLPIEVFDRLKEEVEKYLTFTLSTPTDYIRLSEVLRDEGHGYVSPTTLKRVWGYISDKGLDYRPGSYTLRALCNLIGYKDIDDFENDCSASQSVEYTGKFIESHIIPANSIVELRWMPDRICLLRHIDATIFEVFYSANSRLKRGDRVDCACFTQNAPAYFSRVFRDNHHPFTYVAGAAKGVTYTIFSTFEEEEE